MSSLGLLQLVLVRSRADADTEPFEDAIVRAFQGGKEAGGYLASGEDLGVQLEIYADTPARNPREVLDSFCHTVIIVLLDHNLLALGDQLWDWLASCWQHIQASDGRHAMLVLAMDERAGDRFSAKREALMSHQLQQAHTLGERAIRPAIFALQALHECRLALARTLHKDSTEPVGYLRLFISHAKIDGLPLAHALKHQIESTAFLRGFYDAADIPAGSDWVRELELGVASSIIVMLRTEAYDDRHWCRQEVLWADEYATPAVLVDARTGLNHAAVVLPFDRVPSVRIPDGNLLRILFLALREGLRFLYFMRRVKQLQDAGEVPPASQLRVFCFQPSMAAILRACQWLRVNASSTSDRMILYADPPLRAGSYEAALALVEKYAPGAAVVTPQTLAAIGKGSA